MSSIFGISDLPVETIGDVVQVTRSSIVPAPDSAEIPQFSSGKKPHLPKQLTKDTYRAVNKSNPFIKMRNGFGKLMKHFSKPCPKIK